ncbi:uncharacterized protein LOC119353635 [Triticum dicoccoides]|uniref:uncharacterized protein LOC119353635 n=1 Tax=Triticum dicoccoides TaxID=85692 RepID=UPI00188F34A5|nr:uncharacterized protein LOC119353635 [Triticum dicoccoides]XP_037476171.1 uncharacterized protein LOC119353635 [Triticum dicoccoides]
MPAAAAMRSGVGADGADGVLLAHQSCVWTKHDTTSVLNAVIMLMPARAQIPLPHELPPRRAATHAQTSPPPMASPEEKRREETQGDRTSRSSGGQIHLPRSPRARAPPTTRPCPCVKGLVGDASAPPWPWSFLPIQGLGLDGDGCSSKGTMMNFKDDAPENKDSVLLTRMKYNSIQKPTWTTHIWMS